ncbi:MAG: response regulator [Actinomycetota bacterium]|nr:response regulator [Actinomycetota bacterium]
MQGRILFIDDEPEILKAVKFYLEDEDFEVHIAEEGNRAIELAETIQPDLIILDVMMPVMDGIQVCRLLRSRTRTRLIPIIFLTAREAVEDKIKGLEAGGVDYITKPFNNQELIARIKAHIRSNREELSSHPVTGLPGAPSVEREVNRRLQEGEIFAAVFVEIGCFREYREAYGISRGDRLLLFVSRLLESVIVKSLEDKGFLGMPSYEDFFFTCPVEKASAICDGVIERFEEGRDEHYLEQHRQLGELTYYDYRGDLVRAPFVRLALGGVCNTRRFVTTYAAVAEWGAQALLKARAQGTSACILEE